MATPTTLDTRRPFSRAQARAAGIKEGELRSPRFQRVLYDKYVAADVQVSLRTRAEAALAASPADAYASHHTAARLWGGVVPEHADVHVAVPNGAGRSRRQGVKAHRGAVGAAVERLQGMPISSPGQTFLDLAANGFDLVPLVVLGDSLVKATDLTREQLEEAAGGAAAEGAKRARRAAAFVRSGVDSPQESRLRMLLVLAGLPEPVVNFTVRWPDGSWRMRFDLCYPELKLIVEYDGRQHAESTAQWQRDLKRREELEAQGWRILVVTGDDLQRTPADVLRRVRDALLDRGATGVPRRLRSDWQAHFAR